MQQLFNKVKYLIQRVFRGYSDEDIYDLDWFIIKKIRQPLKAFVKYQEEKGYTLPKEFATDPAAWLGVLKKMEFSFDQVWERMNDTSVIDWEPIKEDRGKEQEGFELFGKYFCDLWN